MQRSSARRVHVPPATHPTRLGHAYARAGTGGPRQSDASRARPTRSSRMLGSNRVARARRTARVPTTARAAPALQARIGQTTIRAKSARLALAEMPRNSPARRARQGNTARTECPRARRVPTSSTRHEAMLSAQNVPPGKRAEPTKSRARTVRRGLLSGTTPQTARCAVETSFSRMPSPARAYHVPWEPGATQACSGVLARRAAMASFCRPEAIRAKSAMKASSQQSTAQV